MLIENQNSEGSLEITRWIQLVSKGFTSTSSTVFWWFLQWPFRKATYSQHHTICLLFCTYKYKCLSRLQVKDRLPKKKKKAILNLTVHPQFRPSFRDREKGNVSAIPVKQPRKANSTWKSFPLPKELTFLFQEAYFTVSCFI